MIASIKEKLTGKTFLKTVKIRTMPASKIIRGLSSLGTLVRMTVAYF
jgi:hypothetical protein